MAGKTDALKALQDARRDAMARAEEAKALETASPGDYSVEECLLRLTIEMYASELKVGLGAMPDGMAVWARLSFPTKSKDPRAGMVSFCVSDETQALLNKAVSALEASPQSAFWKADRFASQTDR